MQKYPLMGKTHSARPFYAARLEEIRAVLPPEVAAKAEERGRQRDLQETAAEILAEYEEVART